MDLDFVLSLTSALPTSQARVFLACEVAALHDRGNQMIVSHYIRFTFFLGNKPQPVPV
jgi:hypothetical protein